MSSEIQLVFRLLGVGAVLGFGFWCGKEFMAHLAYIVRQVRAVLCKLHQSRP